MPRNPDKAPCSVKGCKAWAVRDSDPPLCAPHTPGRTGPSSGNRNALTHGFYAGVFRPEELEGLDPGAAVTSLLDEILRVRAAMCHIEEILNTGGIPGKELRPLGVADYARFISLLLQGANTLTRLVRTHNSLRSNDVDDILREIFDAALDELSEEWGVDL